MAQDSVAAKRLREAIPSYLTARASRDLVVAAHQELTVEWWLNHRQRFDVFVSDFVLRESARGEAAARRLKELEGIPVLAVDDMTERMASIFVGRGVIPGKAGEDALRVQGVGVRNADPLHAVPIDGRL